MTYIYIAAAAFVAAIVTVIVLTILDKKMNKKRESLYISIMSDTSIPVVDGLEKAQSNFRKKSQEWITLNKAIYYLMHSALNDYYTAFYMIEKVFKSKETKQLHRTIIQIEQRRCLCLPEKIL